MSKEIKIVTDKTGREIEVVTRHPRGNARHPRGNGRGPESVREEVPKGGLFKSTWASLDEMRQRR